MARESPSGTAEAGRRSGPAGRHRAMMPALQSSIS